MQMMMIQLAGGMGEERVPTARVRLQYGGRAEQSLKWLLVAPASDELGESVGPKGGALVPT